MIEMNRTARDIGMYDTFYDSPHGLRNDRNFSTAFDVSLLTDKCMQIKTFREVVATRIYECKAKGDDSNQKSFN